MAVYSLWGKMWDVKKAGPKKRYQKLVGGFNSIEKYDRQNGNLPQVGVEIENI